MMRIVLLSLAVAVPVHACLQTYHTTLSGKRKVVSEMPMPTLVEMLEPPASRRAFWEIESQKRAAAKDFQSRNDLAVALIHLGRGAQAIPILEALERERPGVYRTAANLGTAYELAGRNADALRWIREGIRRNPKSHEGTEWLHVAILEAKLAQARDPKWLATHSLLGVDFGPDAVPRMPKRLPAGNDGKPVTAKALRDALYYQMLERRQFVNPPDPYVADLFFDWGNIVALTDTLENAVDLYNESLRFGAPREPMVKKRIAHMKRVIRRAG
ncbi:MAG TPA: tetratricopeptide repeat protein [Thermoanaerobaculia bacterium]